MNNYKRIAEEIILKVLIFDIERINLNSIKLKQLKPM